MRDGATTAPRPPPRSRDELLSRAHGLAGKPLAAIARELGYAPPPTGVRGKGKAGGLVEAALGATGGSIARVDFPELGVELKTIPVRTGAGREGTPSESTFVCKVRIEEADRAEWETSWVAEKLRRVLFVPIGDDERRVVGAPVLWSPTAAQDAALRADFEEIMGLAGVGRIEDVSAHIGAYLQLRPKARDGTPRAVVLGRDGERVATVPRGFYLRAKFTCAILRDPAALP